MFPSGGKPKAKREKEVFCRRGGCVNPASVGVAVANPEGVKGKEAKLNFIIINIIP